MAKDVEIREWPDSSGEDDHGRDAGGGFQHKFHGYSYQGHQVPGTSPSYGRNTETHAHEIHSYEHSDGTHVTVDYDNHTGKVDVLGPIGKGNSVKGVSVSKAKEHLSSRYGISKTSFIGHYASKDSKESDAGESKIMDYAKVYPHYLAFREAHKLEMLVSEGLATKVSFGAIQSKVSSAINANIMAGKDMDCDDDGTQDALDCKYAYVQDLYPTYAVYSMDNRLFQVDYSLDADGDPHLGTPVEVEMHYMPKAASESMSESFAPLQEAGYDSAKGLLTVTIIKPGLSKNNRYYSPELLKTSHKMFEGAKMFADHATDKEMKERPEGSVKDWVASLTKVWPESDGTLKGTAAVVDPLFKQKLDLLNANGQLGQMGVSIRAVGTYSEAAGKREVSSFTAVRSVDFVTFAGAGGQVETLE